MNEYVAPTTPFSDARVDNIANQDGVVDQQPVLSLEVKDDEIIKHLNRRIDDSRDYWNSPKGYNLQSVRNNNVNMHRGRYSDEDGLYAHQIPYVDNELFIAIETIVAYVCAQVPQPEVYPAHDSPESRSLAQDLEKMLLASSETHDLSIKMQAAVRNLLMKRVGFLLLWFDPDFGKNGDIRVSAPNPDHVIIDKNAALGEEPDFVCIVKKASVQKLISMFPDKKEDIFRSLGIKRGTPKQLANTIVYREVKFICYDDDGKPYNAVATYFRDCVLQKSKDPDWIYDEDNTEITNFLDSPTKMIIPFNVINDGTHWVDQTTAMEQAAPIQKLLNRRGRQIMENADKANAVDLFDGQAMTAEAAENITGDPNQKVLVKVPQGKTIRDVWAEKTPHLLPNYVIEDKLDLRATIHNIMGTPNEFSGTNAQDDKTQTLGQSMMIKNQATGRQDAIIRAVERAMGLYFKYRIQMMKVYYTEKHYEVTNGGDGEFDYVEMCNSHIEDGIKMSVKPGTTLAPDKQARQNIAVLLAKMDKIDPYNMYKDLGMDNPKKRYEAYAKYKADPFELLKDVDIDFGESTATIDFVTIMGGEETEPREDATSDHILAHKKQLISEKFLKAPKSLQRKFTAHVQAEVNSLAARNALDELSTEEQQAQQQPQPAPGMMPPGMPPPPGLPGAPAGPPPAPAGVPGGMPPMPAPPMQAPAPMNVAQIMG